MYFYYSSEEMEDVAYNTKICDQKMTSEIFLISQ